MSNKYKHGDTVPTEVICQRLDELVKAVTQGPEAVRREFDMRIPAELDRDADVVISEASNRLQSLQQKNADMQRLCERAYLILDEHWNDYAEDGYGLNNLLRHLKKASEGQEVKDVTLLNKQLSKRIAELEAKLAEREEVIMQAINGLDYGGVYSAEEANANLVIFLEESLPPTPEDE